MSASRKTLLDWSQGRSETFSWDQHDETFTIESKEDVEPLIKLAKDMSDLEPSKEIRHAACIPKFVLDQSLRERWSPKDWKKWANAPENKPFRTWPGQL
jgi:hypothetical protein